MNDTTQSARRRVAGVTVPLFSLRTKRSWGIGEIGDLGPFARLILDGGARLVQLLPLGEIAGGETSPYSALSAFGIDPIYISLGPTSKTSPRASTARSSATMGCAPCTGSTSSRVIDYEAVRWLKKRALDAAFARFAERVHGRGGSRDASFARFCEAHRAWLDDYALFRALKDAYELRAWWEWPEGVRDRDPRALSEARAQYASGVLKHQYLQWLAHAQWESARADLRALGVEVMGDLPFMVGRDSADVWSNRDEFRSDASVGVPGDQFDPEGQEWGLPPYDWRVMRGNGFAWLRRRARYAGVLYDRFRIDHLVGFYRTYMRPVDKLRGPDNKLLPGFFDPAEEPAQKAHGEAVIGAMIDAARETGAGLVAEDLGVIPDYVRPSLAAMGVPGYKVLIWEQENGAFRDPARYPVCSLACFGTHDTSPSPRGGRRSRPGSATPCAGSALASRGGSSLGAKFTPAVHHALMALVLGARSELVLLLMQDVLGVHDRVNTPSTVGPHNWTWRLPANIEALATDEAVRAKLAMVRGEVERARR